jgi:hypothetical protein
VNGGDRVFSGGSKSFPGWRNLCVMPTGNLQGWTVRGSNTSWVEIFNTHPDRLWGPCSLLYNRYWVFPRGKAAGAWL